MLSTVLNITFLATFSNGKKCSTIKPLLKSSARDALSMISNQVISFVPNYCTVFIKSHIWIVKRFRICHGL